MGDYASYDQRAQEVTRAIAKVLHRAGVDVGLLFEKEQNAGNDVRRIGEEGLFSMLRDKNSQGIAAAKFRKLLTTDPHTYNTLKNEYQADGALRALTRREAAWRANRCFHYAELLDELLRAGGVETGKAAGLHGDLPRSVLPGPVQRRVRAAAPRPAGLGHASWWKCRGTARTASAAAPAADGSG